jgi:predicted dehydrogenase
LLELKLSELASLALVGCGAISEEYYLPALQKLPDFAERVWLVDPSERRLGEIVKQFGASPRHAVRSIDELPSTISAAFNATPSHLHRETSLALIGRGVSVFLEKPFAETAADARCIIEAAANKVVLSSNQFRRRYPSYAMVRKYIQEGRLGRIRSIQWAEGYKFEWPAQSGFYFRRPWPDNKPRGVMLDFGSHLADIICWWLNAKPDVVEALSDGFGGPEAYATAKLAHNGASIDIKLSYLTKLSNDYMIVGDEGTIRGAALDMRRIFFTPRGKAERSVVTGGAADKAAIGDELIGNFDRAARGLEPPLIDATTVLNSIQLIDEFYSASKAPLPGYYREWVQ